MNIFHCTIVSANYLAFALTLASSLKEQTGNILHVLLVDRPDEIDIDFSVYKDIRIYYASELEIPNFERITYKFGIVELNTALKPTFLKLLLNDCSQVLYFDPDIYIFNSLDVIYNEFNDHEIIITPHTIAPILDSCRPSDIDHLKTGVFNLGFIGVKKSLNSLNFLNWWEDRCLFNGFDDVAHGTFVDQKWINLVPCYFEQVRILKSKGCNVAYWNLHERSITKEHNCYYVNDQKLVFFHFSGFSPFTPNLLSKHQSRFKVLTDSVLLEILRLYSTKLIENGHSEFTKISYTYGKLSNGTTINTIMRRSLIDFPGVENPFEASSDFQKILNRNGFHRQTVANISSSTSLSNHGIKISIIHFLIRLLARIIGPLNIFQLFKYFSALTRQNYFSNVILGIKNEFLHKKNK